MKWELQPLGLRTRSRNSQVAHGRNMDLQENNKVVIPRNLNVSGVEDFTIQRVYVIQVQKTRQRSENSVH